MKNKTPDELNELIKKLKTAELCMPDGGGNFFVISEDDHIELSDPEVLAVLCHLLNVKVGD